MTTASPLAPTILLLVIALPLAAQVPSYLDLSAGLDEINALQYAAHAIAIPQAANARPAGKSSLTGFAGLTGQDEPSMWLLGGAYQLGLTRNLTLSVGYTRMDAVLPTNTLTASLLVNRPQDVAPWLSSWVSLSHQFYDRAETRHAFHAESGGWDPTSSDPHVLIDSFSWTRLAAGITAAPPVWRFLPEVSLGYLLSRHAYDGQEIVHGPEDTLGDTIDEAGLTDSVIWGCGIGMDLVVVVPYVGITTTQGELAMIARATVVF